MQVDGMVVAGGLRVCQCEARGAELGQKLETEHLVSGAPCGTMVWGDAEKWWVQVEGMVVVEGLCICQCEARGQSLGQKLETKHLSLGFGHTV